MLETTLRCLLVTGLMVGGLAGCVEKEEGLTRAEREQLRQYVSESATSPEHELDISFEDKIELVGYDLSDESWAPGRTITVTWHWKVSRALEDGWNLFTHVADGTGANRLNEDGTGPLRGLYPPGQWKAGEFITDPQEITLPEDWNGDQAVFYLGFWNGPHRLRVTRGANDGDNRARALTVPTREGGGGQERVPGVPNLNAPRGAELNIDGRLDEAAWAQAPWTSLFVNTMNGGRGAFDARAKVLWDDENLYVAFEVQDDFLVSRFDARDDHLWEQDAVEIMIDPDGDGRNYFELQVSPRNQVFDTRYDSRRVPQPIGHADWNAEIETAVQVDGTVNDTSEDEGYTVETAIAWSSFATGTPPASAPSANDDWRINFYVMDSQLEGQRAVGWSPPRVGDFHVPNRFGQVRFHDPSAARAAAPSAGQGGQAAAPSAMAGQVLRPQLRIPAAVRQQLANRQEGVRDQAAALDRADRPQRGDAIPDEARAAAAASAMMN
ncbi:MAG TPA: carbohydrate-binding family 9-like protein [Polyangiaceae bacterium LLY-WYZ-15_(1-7)]|nr:hypothetical protein [Sandaracinus sp.]HJK99972.1 carbohydrate-binding family 9-like protein [Polyangiaceae bacterium LLY-WYZ-15_(1-7)]HJL10344.1 carbohydrate-binding family 9-like protein [Polyangiaceae bacterium LLY-WYZ-15_(1-7)]HJL26260.1 carbohydrate-binding family 9-like protein [Polyangiaceae bacterium LLY-WYZ-15_(1-7)]